MKSRAVTVILGLLALVVALAFQEGDLRASGLAVVVTLVPAATFGWLASRANGEAERESSFAFGAVGLVLLTGGLAAACRSGRSDAMYVPLVVLLTWPFAILGASIVAFIGPRRRRASIGARSAFLIAAGSVCTLVGGALFAFEVPLTFRIHLRTDEMNADVARYQGLVLTDPDGIVAGPDLGLGDLDIESVETWTCGPYRPGGSTDGLYFTTGPDGAVVWCPEGDAEPDSGTVARHATGPWWTFGSE